MQTILLSKTDAVYLQKCAVELGFGWGIIIGQHAEPDKYIVVHLAKNCEEDVELSDSNGDGEDSEQTAQGPQSADDIDTQALTNQWISAYKMIPGSFSVLGIFVTGVKADIIEEHTFKTGKNLLYNVYNLLLETTSLYGSADDVANSDYLFLAFSTAAKKAVCKSYSHSSNGGSFSPVDCRFVEKPFEWQIFECCYELDDIFPIQDSQDKINIEHQFQNTISAMREGLSACEIFIQNEFVDDTLPLEAYIKKKNAVSSNGNGKRCLTEDSYKATIFLPVKCQIANEEPVKVRKYSGTIHFSGVISSRIWCNPKNLLGDVKRFLREDILRSLRARIQVYCDGLTEPHVNNDAMFIGEPPRRVYFSLPPDGTKTNPIQFSEYIFRGEAPTVAVAQAKQILDLDISPESIVDDLEDVPDDDIFLADGDMQAVASQPTTASSRDLTRTMYMLGISVAMLVLILSVLMHYFLRQ